MFSSGVSALIIGVHGIFDPLPPKKKNYSNSYGKPPKILIGASWILVLVDRWFLQITVNDL